MLRFFHTISNLHRLTQSISYYAHTEGCTTRDETRKIVSAHIVQPVESWADMLSKVERFNADNVDNEVYIYEIQVFTP